MHSFRGYMRDKKEGGTEGIRVGHRWGIFK